MLHTWYLDPLTFIVCGLHFTDEAHTPGTYSMGIGYQLERQIIELDREFRLVWKIIRNHLYGQIVRTQLKFDFLFPILTPP
jgi:hypothetical protein